MTYLHCPRCRLAIRCQAQYLAMTNCPRCLARAAVASRLFSSPLTAAELRAGERDVAIAAPSPDAQAPRQDDPTPGRPSAIR